MSNEGYPEKIRALFQEAVALPSDERADYVDAHCGGDEALRRQVLELLNADTAHDDIDAIVGKAAELSFARSADEQLKRRIGNYRLISVVGEGGMGSVYLAERIDEQFQHRVAIKILNSHRPSNELIQRFRTERQILANLDHPNIARLVDGGELEDGLPYLVMEYVDGTPIDRYCTENALSIAQVLKLFVKVCHAVGFAHRNLVVHRDIKPSNILIDENGEPRLLDFGIAKLLEPNATEESSALTRVGARVMTLDYASPEQVLGEVPTVATDIYALGVLLFFLLTDELPHGASAGVSQREREKAIIESLPIRPSKVTTSSEDSPTDSSGTNRRRVHAIRTTKLKGDLDNIVLKALQKDPARRYLSAEIFAIDLINHLSHKPVSARGEHWTYVLGRFLRRNVAGVFTAVAFLVAIGTVSALYTKQLAEQRDVAQLEAQKADQVADFMRRLFRSADPSEALGESTTAAELLDRGTERINTELADQPELRATLMQVIGDVHIELDSLDKAEALLRESLEIRLELFGDNHLETAESALALGKALIRKREVEAAEGYIRMGLTIREQLLGEMHEDTLDAVASLASSLYFQSRFDETKVLYERAMALGETESGQSADFAAILSSYSRLLSRLGEFEKAEVLSRRSLALIQKLFGDVHPNVSNSLFDLAQLLEVIGQYEESERHFRRVLKLDEKLLGEKHAYIATGKTNLGRLLSVRGNLVEAKQLITEAIALRREIEPPNHPDLGTDLQYLAHVLYLGDELDEAEAAHRESLQIRRVAHGADHYYIADNLLGLGRIDAKRGNLDLALQYFNDSHEIYSKKFSEPHRTLATVQYELASIHHESGRLNEALQASHISLSQMDDLVEGPLDLKLYNLTLLVAVNEKLGDIEACQERATAAEIMREQLSESAPKFRADVYVITACEDISK